MMIEYQQEPICVSEAAITAFSQAYTEADIIVPDVKPDIKKVLQVDANTVILSKECENDKITVEAKVGLNILYIGEDDTVKSINSTQNFTHYIDAKGAMSGMEIELEGDVENIEFETINSRKISVRTLIGLDARVVMPLDIKVITDVSGGTFETLRKKINPYNVISRVEENMPVREKLEIPAGKPSIANVLKIDGRVKGSEFKVAANKLIIKGTLCVTTLYLGDMDENIIQFMEHEMPFTEIIDAPGTDEGMAADVDLLVNEMSYDIEEDSDGDSRILIADANVNVVGRVSQQNELDIIEDIYSTEENLCVAKSTAMLDRMVADNKVQITLNETASIPDDMPEIIQVYNVITKPFLSNTRVEGGKIVVEGIIDTYILYLSDDIECPIYTYKHEQKFSQYIDAENVSDDMFCDARIDVDNVSFNIGLGREIQLRFILSIGAKVICTDKIEYVNDVTVSDEIAEAVKPKCSIKIYFVQKGDRLWDIAKKYKTTTDKIKSVNDITEDAELIIGKQIIIP